MRYTVGVTIALLAGVAWVVTSNAHAGNAANGGGLTVSLLTRDGKTAEGTLDRDGVPFSVEGKERSK